MELIFAAGLGAIALWALWRLAQAFKTSAVAAVGYGLVAASAVVQILNITSQVTADYSLVLSVVTTIGLGAGYYLSTRQPARP
jgi:uncharacterized membrane protein